MADNAAIIRDFCAAWSRLDTDELVSYFTEDGVYYNMPTQPVSGHEALTKFIGGFIANWDKTDWKVLNLLADGDVVMVERLDCTIADGKPVDLPCFGIFEMRDGKIAEWRDYFDMATFVNAVS
jgi:limonene-1,2-epoxide hydrolase